MSGFCIITAGVPFAGYLFLNSDESFLILLMKDLSRLYAVRPV